MKSPTKPELPDVVDRKKVGSARAGLPEAAVLRDASEVFKAIANPVRLSIVHALAHDELSVGDLAHALDLSLTTTSQQLAVLRRLRLVAGRDEGRLTFYRVIDDLVGHLVHDCLLHVTVTGFQAAHMHTHGPSEKQHPSGHRRSRVARK